MCRSLSSSQRISARWKEEIAAEIARSRFHKIVSLRVAARWRRCRASRCRAPASRTSTRRVACPRCPPGVAWARWAWPWAWPSDRAPARASSNGTTATRAGWRDRRATSPFTWGTAPGRPAAPRSPTTRRASISTIRTPARPVSVYRTHCIRCLHSSRWTTTTATMDNTLSGPPVMDYTRFCHPFVTPQVSAPSIGQIRSSTPLRLINIQYKCNLASCPCILLACIAYISRFLFP